MRRLVPFLSLLLSLSLLLCACGKPKEPRQKVLFDLFDTVTTLRDDAGDGADAFAARAAIAEEVLTDYHRLLDIYREYDGINNLATLNRLAGQGPVALDGRLIDFLLFASDLCEKSGGALNIVIGALTSLWHEARAHRDPETSELDPALLPTDGQIAEARRHIALSSLVIDPVNKTACLTDPDARIDPGAVGKGYAVERAAEALIAAGVRVFVINAGGNVRVIGTKPDGSGFTTGIRDPEDPASYALTMTLSDASLVTSGDYERYFTAGGVRYHHIIDPATGYPADTYASVSVLARDAGLCDALSTALFCMERDAGLSLARSLGAEVFLVTKEGERVFSDGFLRSWRAHTFF